MTSIFFFKQHLEKSTKLELGCGHVKLPQYYQYIKEPISSRELRAGLKFEIFHIFIFHESIFFSIRRHRKAASSLEHIRRKCVEALQNYCNFFPSSLLSSSSFPHLAPHTPQIENLHCLRVVTKLNHYRSLSHNFKKVLN